MEKNKKVTLIILVVVVVVVLGVALGVKYFKSSTPAGQSGVPSQTAGTANGAAGTSTVAPVPTNVTVPDKGTSNVPTNVAVPQVQSAAAPQSSSSYRGYTVSINNDTYTPSTIIVKQGDTVNVDFTAVDKNYDFSQPNYGLMQSIPKGATRKVQFEAMTVGKYTFFCPSCGGPDKGPVGYFIVTAQ